ncbi:MAG: ABC transporter ATP-binding protein [Thermodesulfobacteriota bacterium]|nr:ABC transporter ATP-binding protein [Thermodesulfobacteriota bacterium]
MPDLAVRNVEVRYQWVILGLSNVSLDLENGKVVSVLGPNGAGKSTTLKAISGLLHTEEGKVTRGSITLDDKPIHDDDPETIASMGIIQVIEGRRLFGHLTVEQNLVAGAYMINAAEAKKNLENVFTLFPTLKRLRNNVSGYISGGEQQMLVTGRALMSRPKILMLDEPSLGLAPVIIKDTYEKLAQIKKDEGISILLAEQNAIAALNICDYAYVLENGRVVLDGPSEKLKGNKDIQEFYLGLSELGSRKSYAEVKHYRRRKRWL